MFCGTRTMSCDASKTSMGNSASCASRRIFSSSLNVRPTLSHRILQASSSRTRISRVADRSFRRPESQPTYKRLIPNDLLYLSHQSAATSTPHLGPSFTSYSFMLLLLRAFNTTCCTHSLQNREARSMSRRFAMTRSTVVPIARVRSCWVRESSPTNRQSRVPSSMFFLL